MVTPGRKYARGHAPASHKNNSSRGLAISKVVKRQYATGRPGSFRGKHHSVETKEKLRHIALHRTPQHKRNMELGLTKRNSDQTWLASIKANLVKASEARKGTHHSAETRQKMSVSASRARRKGLANGTIVVWNKDKRGVQVAWNRGLTKHDHPGMAKVAESVRQSYADGSKQNTSRASWRVRAKTRHNGFVTFRSRLELKFARSLDVLNIRWQYEPRRFSVALDGQVCSYTPDFYLPAQQLYVEVKGQLTAAEIAKYAAFRSQYPALRWIHLQTNTVKRFAEAHKKAA